MVVFVILETLVKAHWLVPILLVGSILAGHEECPGDIVEEDGKKYKLFYGMSSDTAMNKHQEV